MLHVNDLPVCGIVVVRYNLRYPISNLIFENPKKAHSQEVEVTMSCKLNNLSLSSSKNDPI